MEEKENFYKKTVDNSSYRERFQFQLKVNGNIICQRYFKIARFNNDSLVSGELYDTLHSIVMSIRRDLESKSRIYIANICSNEVKLTGIKSKLEAIEKAKCLDRKGLLDCGFITEEEYESNESDDVIKSEAITYIFARKEADETSVMMPKKEWDETEIINYGDVTFKFSFIVDDKTVYEEIWDGSQYPKYVRNSVDITNNRSQYPLVQMMNSGKEDLAVQAINRICDVCSNKDYDSERRYTKSFYYGDKKYSYGTYNREYVNMWRSYCARKYGKETV